MGRSFRYFYPEVHRSENDEPGKSFDISKVDPTIQRGLEGAPHDAQKLMVWKLATIATVVNGWSMNTDTMGVYGNSGGTCSIYGAYTGFSLFAGMKIFTAS